MSDACARGRESRVVSGDGNDWVFRFYSLFRKREVDEGRHRASPVKHRYSIRVELVVNSIL